MWPWTGSIRTYALFYLASILLHFVVSFLIARRLRLRWAMAFLIGACYLLGMTVGAKALYDLQAGNFSARSLVSVDHYQRGGMWGGPLAYLGLAVSLVVVLSKDRRAGLDLIALAAPIPMSLAKIACLCQGCCHGKPTSLPWAITFPDGDGAAPAGVALHPTQVYEMLVLALTAAVLFRFNRPQWRGMLLFWFLAVYGIGRPLTELFRGDLAKQPYWGPFTQTQWLCAAASAISICILLLHYRRARPISEVSRGANEQTRPAGADCGTDRTGLPTGTARDIV